MTPDYPTDFLGASIKVGSTIMYAISRGTPAGLKGPAVVETITPGHALYRGLTWSFKVRIAGGKPSIIHHPDRIVVIA